MPLIVIATSLYLHITNSSLVLTEKLFKWIFFYLEDFDFGKKIRLIWKISVYNQSMSAPMEWLFSCKKFRFDLLNFKFIFTLWFEFIFLDVPDRQVLNSPKRPTRLKVTSNGNTDHVTYIVIILVVVVVCATISYFVYKHRKYNYIRRKNEVVWIYNSENVHGFFFYRNQLRFSHRVIITFFFSLVQWCSIVWSIFQEKKILPPNTFTSY